MAKEKGKAKYSVHVYIKYLKYVNVTLIFLFSRDSQCAPHLQPWQLDYNQPPGILDTPESSRGSVPTTPSTLSVTPSLQNISSDRGHGGPRKQLTEPSYEGYPAHSAKEEKAKWLKMKATEQWHYNILMSNKAAEYWESECERVSAYNKCKKQ